MIPPSSQSEALVPDPQLKSATENLQQPFKFVATIIFIFLPRMPKVIQSVIVTSFVLVIVLLCFAALKQFGGIDLFSFMNKEDYDYQVAGELVPKGRWFWPHSSYGVELTSPNPLFTRKEVRQGESFRLFWIIRFPRTELDCGQIDMSVGRRDSLGRYNEFASSLQAYSALFDPSHPYRWVRLVIDTTNPASTIQVTFAN